MENISVGSKFKIIKPKCLWQMEFMNSIFVVCDGYNPNHHQIPTMTKYGRTWFDRDAVEIIND